MSTALIRSSDAHKSTRAQAVYYARLSATVASVATNLGFIAAKEGTHLGFSFVRGLTTTAISLTSTVAEQTIFGKPLGVDTYLNHAVRKTLDLAETVTLFPLDVGAKVANAGLTAASYSIEGVSFVLGVPCQDDDSNYNLSFSMPASSAHSAAAGAVGEFFGPFSATAQSFTYAIPSLVRVLQDEWQHPQDPDQLPAERYSAMSVGRALIAWASIQKVTRVYHEKKWFKSMKEIQDWEWRGHKDPRQTTPKDQSDIRSMRPRSHSRRNTLRGKRPSSVHIVSDVHLPNHGGEILTAEIGERADAHNPFRNSYRLSTASFSRASFMSMSSISLPPNLETPKVPYSTLRNALRRFSRMVLGGYGGAGVVFFGVQIPSSSKVGHMAETLNNTAKSFGLSYASGQGDAGPSSSTKHGATENHSRPSTSHIQPEMHFDIHVEPPSASSSQPESGGGGIPFPTSFEYDERMTLEQVVDTAEQIESDDEDDDGASAWDVLEPPSPLNAEFHHNPSLPPEEPNYSWWNLLMGKHDTEVFKAFATSHDSTVTSPTMSTAPLPGARSAETLGEKPKKKDKAGKHLPTTAHAGDAERLPRFWVLTDHGRQQIVLVLRGTMTLNEVAIDLACDVTPFTPASTGTSSASSSRTVSPTRTESHRQYHVHQGMYALASLMGSPGKPVHEVVAKALEQNEDYELVLCGHSLGAGVCSLLGLMWADPETCLTVPSGGLPEGRPVSVFCFAPPCVMSPSLSRLASSLITSFAYSHDAITRLSLGSVRDLQRVTSWLCYGQKKNPDSKESCSSIIQRAVMLEKNISFMGIGADREAEEAWFLSLRKTLEANMRYADLFPPGRILWAIRDSSFHRSYQKAPFSASPDVPRVFEVEKVEDVFGQVVFARDMLTSHFVQNYDRVLHEFL